MFFPSTGSLTLSPLWIQVRLQVEAVHGAVPQWTDARAILKALRQHNYDVGEVVAWASNTNQLVSIDEARRSVRRNFLLDENQCVCVLRVRHLSELFFSV